ATGRVRDLFWLGALAVAPLAALVAFDLVYYGAVLPHSFYLKQISRHYAPGFAAQAAALTRFYVGYYPGYVLLAGVAMCAAVRSFHGARGGEVPPLAFLAAYVALSFASFLVGPVSDTQRYTVHVLPIVAVLALAGWRALSPRVPTAGARRITL